MLDPCRNKAALCPRRSGKSYAILTYALWLALKKPGAKILIICKTRKQCKNIYWNELKKLCNELDLGTHYRNVELEVEFDNGSFINFSGADTTEEIEKFRGGFYDLVCIDECKSYAPSLLNELLNDVLKPALADRRGTLVLIGTPGAILAGPFFDITTGKKTRDHGGVRFWRERETKPRQRWSVHFWTSRDNIYKPHIWEDALVDKELAEWPDDHPTWVREYLGQWVPDDDALVYAYSKANLTIKDGVPLCEFRQLEESDNAWGLPPGHEWRYLLGLDLGYHDDTALVVAAWAETCPQLHYIWVEKHTAKEDNALTVEMLATRVEELEALFGGFDARVADTGGLGKFIVHSLSQTYGVHFVAAEKTQKHDHIKLLNSDMMSGRIKVYPDSPLAEEWLTLQWAGPDRKIEDPGSPNHAADAALYLWRYAYHHFWEAKTTGPRLGTEDWWKAKEKADAQRYEQQLLEQKATPWWSDIATVLDRSPDEDEWNLNDLLD